MSEQRTKRYVEVVADFSPEGILTSQPPQACDFSHELGGFSLDL